uniref:Uncharacterized protein n=1 Tax=Arundo donax TaxID=35708 RepID=A0A0A9FCY4_ARUDO
MPNLFLDYLREKHLNRFSFPHFVSFC